MPAMDGAECVAKLVQRDPQLRILVISALADKLTAIDALEKGASGFLCKPFSDRQLNEVMVNFWENHFSVYGSKMPSPPTLFGLPARAAAAAAEADRACPP